MHRREIMKLIGKSERAGYTLVPLDLHFTRGRVKVTVALAPGCVNLKSVLTKAKSNGNANENAS